MQVILYMSITADGFIAGENDDVSWISKNSWKSYQNMLKRIRCAIVGRKTYELMKPNELVKNCLYIVCTHRKLSKKSSTVRFTDQTPKKILNSLEKEGIKHVCLIGGATLNNSFLKDKLIDEIFLDVEPVTLGRGIRLFSNSNVKTKLKLLKSRKLSKNEIQLHYKVIK